MPEGGSSLPVIAGDEDLTTGFMLADEAAPATPEERERRFAELAVAEWDTHYDPAEVEHRFAEARPYKYTDDDEMLIEASEGETPDEWWFVFDLPDEAKPCGYCGKYLTHADGCERAPEVEA